MKKLQSPEGTKQFALKLNQSSSFFKGKYQPFVKFNFLCVGLHCNKIKATTAEKGRGLKIDFSISRSFQYGPQLMEWGLKNPLKRFCVCAFIATPSVLKIADVFKNAES